MHETTWIDGRADSGTTLVSIDAVRRFNRFYTRQLGLLSEGLLDSSHSLAEARVLYELAHRPDTTAAALGRELRLDPGYLSRILKKLKRIGLVEARAGSDARQRLLRLTGAGRAAFEPLDRASREQVTGWLAPLSNNQAGHLVRAMRSIEELLGEVSPGPRTVLLRPHQVGDIGWIIRRQGLLYAQEYGWDETFEALVAEIASGFVKNFVPAKERCWVAEIDGGIAGAVFLVRESDLVAKLRLLYVEPEARGLGIGRRLVDEVIRFSRQAGYSTLTLWTNDILVSARRIYQAAGFRLTAEERHHSFGKDLVGQYWELAL